MINLLPYDIKKQTKAARTNIMLLSYTTIMILAIAFLALGCTSVYFIINNKETHDKQFTDAQKSNQQSQVGVFNNNLITAKNILSQRTSYGDLLTNFTAILPEGAIIESLSVNDSILGTPVTIKIKVKSVDIEPKLKMAFQSSPQFSNYNHISSTPNTDNSSNYSSTLSINLTFNKVVN